jgi:hypothetical protein
MSISSALAYAEDMTNSVDVMVSENTNPIYVVVVSNDQVAFNDTSAARVVSKTRITIADGYRPYIAQQDSPFDGYLNPDVRQLTPAEIKLYSPGQLSSNMFLIGPILFPYVFGGKNYGLDPLLVFQPSIGGNNNLQVYVQIFGLGLPNTTNYFVIKRIILSGKGIAEGLAYKVLIEAAMVNIQ